MILARLVENRWDSIRFFLYVNHAGLRGFRINIYNISSGTECSASLMAAHCVFFSAWPGVYFFRGFLFWENMKTVQFRFLRAQTSRHTRNRAWRRGHLCTRCIIESLSIVGFRGFGTLELLRLLGFGVKIVNYIAFVFSSMSLWKCISIFFCSKYRGCTACLVVIFPRLPGLPVEIATLLDMQRLGHSLT